VNCLQYPGEEHECIQSLVVLPSFALLRKLREAQRTGDMVADGESGLKLNELYPNRYPVKAAN
jgi:hypothetical protein